MHCWAYPDRRITTDRHRCRNRRCGSWPRSMPSNWTNDAVVTAGWSSTWPEKASRSATQKPRSTVPGDPSERFPCLVKPSQITAVDQVWGTDITYIPLQKGFLYLVAIVDLFFRIVLSWKLSNSLDTEFCLEALEMAPSSARRPQIFHSDQGCQFTATNFVSRLQAEEIKISWSSRKRCYDNILVERL